MKEYLSSFNPRLNGVGGDAEEVAAVAQGLSGLLQEDAAQGRRLHDGPHRHLYLMGKNGKFVTPFSLKRQPEDAAADCGAICDERR